MRIEEILSKALKKVDNDRYILALAVGQRADELSKGARPLIEDPTTKNMKYTDIALKEIADGILRIDGLEDKVK